MKKLKNKIAFVLLFILVSAMSQERDWTHVFRYSLYPRT